MSRILRVLITEPDAGARRRAIRLLMDVRELEIVTVCTTSREAVAGIRRERPNLLLMDAELSEPDIRALVREVGPGYMPYTIFTAPQDSAVLRTISAHGLHVLTKPVDSARFATAIETARANFEARTSQIARLSRFIEETEEDMMPEATAVSAPRRYLERVLIRQSGQIIFLKVNDIDWLEAAANYIRVHAGKDSYLIRDTMTAMEQKLPPDSFVRVHRSTIVNVDRIARMYQWFSGDYMVVLKDGSELRLSRHYRARLEERMIKHQ